MALQGSTQGDGLSHGWYGGSLYNGVPESAIRSSQAGGASKLGIENVKTGFVGRGSFRVRRGLASASTRASRRAEGASTDSSPVEAPSPLGPSHAAAPDGWRLP